MPRNNQSLQSRTKLLRYVVAIAFAIITVRLFFIQIIEHNAWVAKADEQHTLLETITAKRGEIYMMDKGEPVPVVLNQTTYQIIIDPAITEKEPIEKALKTYSEKEVARRYMEVYKK